MDRREELFWKKVNKDGPNGCWLWTNETCGKTHGHVTYKGVRTSPHRVAWILTKGPIPDGMNVLHDCDVGICVNPAHLKLGTHLDNMRDMWERGRGVPSMLKGEEHGMAIVNATQVLEIQKRYAEGGVSQQALADEYGLSQSQTHRIIHKQTWKHLNTS